MGEFAVSIEHSEVKSVSASGGLRPPHPRPGALPLDPAGGKAPDPRCRLALRALAMAPLCQILNTPLFVSILSSESFGSIFSQRTGFGFRSVL